MIRIAERLHPFSHQPGVSFLLPGTDCKVRVYPTRLHFTSPHTDLIVDLDLLGPVDGFTAELNLEENCLKVWGKTTLGFIRFHILCKEDGIWLFLQKAPQEEMHFICGGIKTQLKKGESAHLIQENWGKTIPNSERLSLGVTKAQQWEKMKQRQELTELLPLWVRMGQRVPSQEEFPHEKTGMFALLNACRQVIERREKTKIVETFRQFFLAAFEGVFVPRAEDTEFQGIVKNQEGEATLKLPLALLKESAALLRSLLFQEGEQSISLLPCLPPEFHCGRGIHIKTSFGVLVDFEWTKKSLRRVRLYSDSPQAFKVILPRGTRGYTSCRLKWGKEKSQVKVENGSFSVDLLPRQEMWLDLFQ